MPGSKKKGEGETLLGKSRAEQARNRVISTKSSVERPVQSVTPTGPVMPTNQQGGRQYGQVRRRANSAQQKGHIEIDDDI